MRASENTTPTSIRLSPDLYKKLDAAREGRSLGEEIRRRLEASFGPTPTTGGDPLFRDLLTALGCAAAAATKLLPSPPQGMLTMADNERREWLERQHPGFQDATAFEVFEEAAAMLFQAFKPEGFTAVTDETSLRLCYQLASLALGQMGARGIDAFTRLAPLDQDLMARWGGREAERISAAAEDQDDKP